MDEVATMEVGDRSLTEDIVKSKLIYFVKGDGSSGVALQGDSGDKGPVGSRGPTGKCGVDGPKVLLERLVKWDMLGAELELEHMVKKVTRETLVVLVNKDLYVHKLIQVQEVCKVRKGFVELMVSKVLLECKKGDKGIQGSVGAKGNCGE